MGQRSEDPEGQAREQCKLQYEHNASHTSTAQSRDMETRLLFESTGCCYHTGRISFAGRRHERRNNEKAKTLEHPAFRTGGYNGSQADLSQQSHREAHASAAAASQEQAMGELKSEPTLKTHLEPSRGRAGLTEVRGAQGGGEAGVGSRFGLGIEVWGWGRIDHISKCYGPHSYSIVSTLYSCLGN